MFQELFRKCFIFHINNNSKFIKTMLAEYLEYKRCDDKVKALELICVESSKRIFEKDLQKCRCNEKSRKRAKGCISIVHKNNSFYF
jgi:hypothetical protein